MSHPSQTVLLADTFPAKAYLLISHLTVAEPSVSSFSSNGSSFEIYDQNTFAQKYLPQFFKHSNYGSFVRQLNLYGFTSSRLKGNSDVVVWHHASFQRDRQDLVKDMKRTKKAKHKPAPPLPPVPLRIQSPSISDDGDSLPSHSHVAKPADVDRGWLAAEFAKIAAQNKFLEAKISAQSTLLETKLETLLQVTLRMTPASFEEAEPGGKRCRTSPVQSDPPALRGLTSVQEEQKVCDDGHYWTAPAGDNYTVGPASCTTATASHHKTPAPAQHKPGSVSDEQKVCDGDNYVIEPLPYCGDKESTQLSCPTAAATHHEFGTRDDARKTPVHQLRSVSEEQKVCDDDQYAVEPAPHQGDRESTQMNCPVAASHHTNHDSLARFVHVMLDDEDLDGAKQEEGISDDVHKHDTTSIKSQEASLDEELVCSDDNHASLRERVDGDDNLGDELMEEALDALDPDATMEIGDDFFDGIEEAEEADEAEAQPQPDECPRELVTIANRAEDKTDGPQPVQSSSPVVPIVQSGDIEEGNLPAGITVVAARAEVVEEDSGGDPNAAQHRPHEWRDRRKVICLLTFIGTVLSIGVTLAAVFATKNSKHGKRGHPHPPRKPMGPGHKDLGKVGSALSQHDATRHGLTPCQKRGTCKSGNSGIFLSPPERKNNKRDTDHDDRQEEVDIDNNNVGSGASANGWRLGDVRRSYTAPVRSGKITENRKRSASLFGDARDDSFPSVSLTLGGTDFLCKRNS